MKKIMLMAFAAGLFAFTSTSCSSDDDGGGSSSDCITCSMDFEGNEFETEYCDNGDGTATVTVTSGGQSVSQEQDIPEDFTFEDYVDSQEQSGADCN